VFAIEKVVDKRQRNRRIERGGPLPKLESIKGMGLFAGSDPE